MGVLQGEPLRPATLLLRAWANLYGLHTYLAGAKGAKGVPSVRDSMEMYGKMYGTPAESRRCRSYCR